MKRENRLFDFHFVKVLFLGIMLVMLSTIGASASFKTTSDDKFNPEELAQFEINGNGFITSLSNKDLYDVTQSNEMLSALFFSLPGNPSLTALSGIIGMESAVASGNINPLKVDAHRGEWAYGGYPKIESDEPFSLFSADSRVADRSDTSTKWRSLKRAGIFKLAGIKQIQDLSKISFQYDPDATSPGIGKNAAPEPNTMVLFGSGLLAIVGMRQRAARNSATGHLSDKKPK